MTRYGARIFDSSEGRFVFSAPSLCSPYRVGLVSGSALSVLLARKGRQARDLQLRPFVIEGAGQREMTLTEEAAVGAGLEQFGSLGGRESDRSGLLVSRGQVD